MIFTPTKLPDVIVVSPEVFPDARGEIWEVYHQKKFAENGIPHAFVQDNQSISRQTVLRGLHYQIKQPQGKLVRVVQGEIYDVAVDLRRSSPSYGQWVGIILSSENKTGLWIPPGFAHGFYTLSQWAQISYKATDLYSAEYERTLLWNDPQLAVDWPLIDNKPPILSVKDADGLPLEKAEVYK